METLILNQTDVEKLLPMEECITLMEETFRALHRGDAAMPLRSVLWNREKSGALGLMPAWLGLDTSMLGVKAVTFFPGNRESGLDSHQGAILLFEAAHGRLLAICDATAVTAIRTAAVSALATKILAREDAGDLAIFGSGTQARTHLEAIMCVRKLRRVRVWSRTANNAELFARRESASRGIAVERAATAREAASGADILCTVTSSTDPFLRQEWVGPGAHINAAGASIPTMRELDAALVARSHFFGDWRDATLVQAGDFVLARDEGKVADVHLAGDLADLVAGRVAGRRSREEVTVFKSLGLAAEDIACAGFLYKKGMALGTGARLELGGLRSTG